MENNYCFGDILWCKRTFCCSSLKTRHEEGPFIVLKQTDGFIYALKGAGACNESSRHAHSVYVTKDDTLSDNRIALRKVTKFQPHEIFEVPYDCVIRKLGTLNSTKINELKKKLLIQSSLGRIDLEKIGVNIKVKFIVGDIISNGHERYLVIDDSNDKNYIVISYLEAPTSKMYFEYMFDNLIFINKTDESYQLIGSLSQDRITSINNHYFKFKTNGLFNVSDDSKIDPGSLIISFGKLFYVSTIEQDVLLCYPVELVEKNKGNFTYKGYYFNISFKQEKISKNIERNFVVFKLDDEKMNVIRKLKKQDKINSKKSSYNIKKNPHKEIYKRTPDYYKIGDPNFNYFSKVLYKKGVDSLGYAAYEIISKSKIDCVDLAKLTQGSFELVRFDMYQLEYATTNRANLLHIIGSIDKEINDPRYDDFLIANGIFNIDKVKNDISRSRKK
ncbi:MAG: hypothetical protein J5634_04175 [Bacilli bacterium]|nr:hypothetical protein [Bacilli bacterium]